MKNVIVSIVASMFIGCASTPKISSSLDKANIEFHDGALGINKDKRIVLTDETPLLAELKKVEFKLDYTMDQTRKILGYLEQCVVKNSSSPGEINLDAYSVESLLPSSKIESEIGLNADGELVAVRQEDVLHKIKSMKAAAKAATSVLDSARKQLAKCEIANN